MKKPNASRTQRALIQIIVFLITAALIWWTLRQVSFPDLWQTLENIPPAWIALLIAANAIVIWLFSRRWQLLLQVLNYAPPYQHLMAYRLVSFGISYFTPGTQFGGEPAQVMLLSRRDNIPMSDAILSVAVDKLFELTFNFAFLGIGILVIFRMGFLAPQSLIGVSLIAILLVGIPIVILSMLCGGKKPIPQWTTFWQQKLMRYSKVRKVILPIIETVRKGVSLCRTAPRQMILAMVLSIIVWLALIAEYWLMTRALGLHLSLTQTIILLTAARLAFLFPTPGGLGALESGQVIAMGLLGFDAALGLSLSLLIRARDVFFGLAGLWIGKVLSHT